MIGGTEGELLGSYRLVRKLGRGGMGEVWLAEHVQIKSQVAIKLVLGEPTDDGAAARFLREAKATARIRHPGVVTVSDFGERPGGGAYLVMELLDGETLAQRLERGAVPLELALDLGLQIVEALAAAHAAEVIHRDLKPANVFLVPDPAARSGLRVKLLDFGVAKATGKVTDELGLTVTGALVGTPVYMAPEQCTSRRGPVDHRADLYALGVVLYEMLTGKPPFRGPTLGDLIDQHLNATPSPLRSSTPGVPPRLDALVLALLAKQREDRPASANDVARTLAELGNVAPAIPASGPEIDATLASGARSARAALDETQASGARSAPTGLEETRASGAGSVSVGLDAPPTTSAENAVPAVSVASPPSRRRWWIGGSAAVLAVGAGIIGIVVTRGGGERTVPDLSRATDEELSRACDRRDGFACHAIALRELRAPKTPELTRVFGRMLTACDHGVLDGCAHAARLVFHGAGVPHDAARALSLAKRACDGQHAFGCSLLGDLIAYGVGRDAPSRAPALPIWQRGCELGSPPACEDAAWTLRHGLGVPADGAAADRIEARLADLADRACTRGDPDACRAQAHLQLRGAATVSKDVVRAAQQLTRACDLGSAEACAELAESYALGAGVTASPERARELYERSCQHGSPIGCSGLALAMGFGLLGPVDAARAVEIARTSCDTQGPRACIVLGNFYSLGIGVPVDRARAAGYLERACAGGEAESCSGVAMQVVPGRKRSAAEIDALLERACALGSGTGCLQAGRRAAKRGELDVAHRRTALACALSNSQVGCDDLATQYFEGRGVPADPTRGRELLETSCRTGAQISCHALGERLRDGNGLPAQPIEAVDVFDRACQLGWGQSCLAAADMLSDERAGLTPEPERAAKLRAHGCKVDPGFCRRQGIDQAGSAAP